MAKFNELLPASGFPSPRQQKCTGARGGVKFLWFWGFALFQSLAPGFRTSSQVRGLSGTEISHAGSPNNNRHFLSEAFFLGGHIKHKGTGRLNIAGGECNVARL